MASSIIISDETVNEILRVIGYPLVLLEDTEIQELDDFKELIVRPSLREYFTHFPMIYSTDAILGVGPFEVVAPESIINIYNATVKLNNYSSSTSNSSLLYNNVFSNAFYIRPTGSNSIGIGNYDYGLQQASVYKRVEMASMNNMNKMFRFDFDRTTKRKVTGYNNTMGKAEVQWMTYSDNFDDTMFELKNTVIQYAQGMLLETLGMIRNQLNSKQADSTFNAESFITKGNDLKTQAVERYQGTVMNPVVMRG